MSLWLKSNESTRTFSLYNFIPDAKYTYVVRTGDGGNYRYACGALPTPTMASAESFRNIRRDLMIVTFYFF